MSIAIAFMLTTWTVVTPEKLTAPIDVNFDCRVAKIGSDKAITIIAEAKYDSGGYRDRDVTVSVFPVSDSLPSVRGFVTKPVYGDGLNVTVDTYEIPDLVYAFDIPKLREKNTLVSGVDELVIWTDSGPGRGTIFAAGVCDVEVEKAKT